MLIGHGNLCLIRLAFCFFYQWDQITDFIVWQFTEASSFEKWREKVLYFLFVFIFIINLIWQFNMLFVSFFFKKKRPFCWLVEILMFFQCRVLLILKITICAKYKNEEQPLRSEARINQFKSIYLVKSLGHKNWLSIQ